MKDPAHHYAKTWRYALEFDEDRSKAHLRALTDGQMQDLVNTCDILKRWAQEVWIEDRPIGKEL